MKKKREDEVKEVSQKILPMQIKLKTNELLRALEPAATASTQSAGGLVELETASGKVKIRGTDGELFVQRNAAVDELDTQGRVIVAGRPLLGLVRESGGAEVVIQAHEEKLSVSCSAGRYELLCAVGVTLPQPPTTTEAGTHLEAATLVRLLQMTAFAASSKEMRYAMNGVCLSIKRGILSAAATDGRRLAVARASVKRAFKGEIIVPLRAIGELTRLLTDCGSEVELWVTDNFLVVRGACGEVAARLVEGRFPAYEEVIPDEGPVVAWVGKEDLGRAMKIVPFLSSDEYRAARLSFAPERIEVEFGSPEHGEGRMDIAAECSGGEVVVWLNPGFVLDVLRVLTEEKVEMRLRDAEGAIVFRQGKEFTYVVMPISQSRSDGTTPA